MDGSSATKKPRSVVTVEISAESSAVQEAGTTTRKRTDIGANFYNSATSLVQEVYETTVSIFRNIIPPTAGFDLSPLIAFFVFQLAERVLEILMFEYMV